MIKKYNDLKIKYSKEFIMFEAVVLGFYNLNPELFKESVNYDLWKGYD